MILNTDDDNNSVYGQIAGLLLLLAILFDALVGCSLKIVVKQGGMFKKVVCDCNHGALMGTSAHAK